MAIRHDVKTENVMLLRSSLVNWYPFPGGERALLLGENTRPLLRLLEKSYTYVDTQIGKGPYDCIVAADLVEMTENVSGLLENLSSILSEDGVMLLAFRNRFALKYLCGGTDELVKTPFSTLGPAMGCPRLYGRREMENLLHAAGFAETRCYFLMPDADFVQAVFTEERLPEDSIRDRVLPLDLHESPLIAWEGDLYDDMVREGTLPEHCAVYLEECRKPYGKDFDRHVIYAAISTDRGEKRGFATLLYSDGTAAKFPLFPEGLNALEDIFANMTALRDMGIPTVPCRLDGVRLEMPVIDAEGLCAVLRRMLSEDPEEFLAVFDQIYRDVLTASPETPTLPDDLADIWGADSGMLAPVLEKAFIDMIPYNAFWSDGRPMYFDQEFLVENCPAKYVLFRALFYTWLHIPEAERKLPLNHVKERFGLTGLWDGFARREERFVEENRNWNGDMGFVKEHCHVDLESIDRRRRMLDPAIILRDVHAVQLESLKELDRVCRVHGLRYMAVHGTLLGAVRHEGFIPWDDDVDIVMHREDYDRLLELADENCFARGFFLQTPLNDYGCFYGGYSKLRRDGTAALETYGGNKPTKRFHNGIWIDIMPLDAVPEDPVRRRKLQRKIGFLQRIIYAKAYAPARFVPDDVPGISISLYYLLAKLTRRRRLIRKIDDLCRKQSSSPMRGIIACYYGSRENKNIWNAEDVDTTEKVPFEDMTIPIPAGWQNMLAARYGKDFMSDPPPEKKYRHTGIEFYTDVRSVDHGKS